MLSDKIKYLRKKNKLSIRTLANNLNVSYSSISLWENQQRTPDLNMINKIANYFNVSVSELIEDKTNKFNRIPVLGIIPAGVPIEMVEDVIDYEELNPEMFSDGKEYFALRIKGNSMFPKYLNNDVIIVLKKDNCESGQDCVIAINGNDATFKKVIKKNNSIVIQPINLNDYSSVEYTEKQIEELPIRILGVVVEIRRTV